MLFGFLFPKVSKYFLNNIMCLAGSGSFNACGAGHHSWPSRPALITHPHKPAFLSVAFDTEHKQMRSGMTALSLGWLAV